MGWYLLNYFTIYLVLKFPRLISGYFLFITLVIILIKLSFTRIIVSIDLGAEFNHLFVSEFKRFFYEDFYCLV